MRGDWPKKRYVRITFDKIGDDQTQMVISHKGIPKEMYDACVETWSQSLDKFQEVVERHGDEHFKKVVTEDLSDLYS